MADINKTVVPADAFSTVDHDEYAAAEIVVDGGNISSQRG